MNGFTFLFLQSLVVLFLATVFVLINSQPFANNKKDEQNTPNSKIELLKNVLEIVVLLISLFE